MSDTRMTGRDWRVDFEETLESLHESEVLQYKRDRRTLHKQKRKLSPYLFSQLKSILEFYETTWGYNIVQVLGENATKEKDDFHGLRHLFTDIESADYGYSGEMSSGGEVWIPIRNGNYFKFSFAM